MDRETITYFTFICITIVLMFNVFQDPLNLGGSLIFDSRYIRVAKINHYPEPSPPYVLTELKNRSCERGHVIGMKPICEGDGCLRVISKVKSHPKNVTIDQAQMETISKMGGYVMSTPLHASFVTNITQMQWRFGVYGSVGEIGVFHGKFTSILGLNTDIENGERLVVADPFGFIKHNINQHHFFRNMKKWMFSPSTEDESQRLRVWVGSSLFLSKSVFLRWNIPAFRLFSIDGDHTRKLVLSDYRLVSCITREGGILVFDDVGYRWETQVDQGITDFFSYFGYSAFRPLVIITNKLFVCTNTFYARYMDYIRKHLAARYGLEEVTRYLYSQNEMHTYFTNVPY